MQSLEFQQGLSICLQYLRVVLEKKILKVTLNLLSTNCFGFQRFTLNLLCINCFGYYIAYKQTLITHTLGLFVCNV